MRAVARGENLKDGKHPTVAAQVDSQRMVMAKGNHTIITVY